MHRELHRPMFATGIVKMYIDAKRLSRRPISVFGAVNAVKTASPRSGLSDQEVRELAVHVISRLRVSSDDMRR